MANKATNIAGTPPEPSKRVRAGPATSTFHPPLTYNISYRKNDNDKIEDSDCELLTIRTPAFSSVNTGIVLADSFRFEFKNIAEKFNQHAENFDKLDEWHKGQILALEKLNEEDQQTMRELQQHRANHLAEIDGLCKTHKNQIDTLRALRKHDQQTAIKNLEDSEVAQSAKIQEIRAGYENQLAELRKSQKKDLETIKTFKKTSAQRIAETKKLHRGYRNKISKLEKYRTVNHESIVDLVKSLEGGIKREEKLDADFENLRANYEELNTEHQSLKEVSIRRLNKLKEAKEWREKKEAEMKTPTQQSAEHVAELLKLQGNL